MQDNRIDKSPSHSKRRKRNPKMPKHDRKTPNPKKSEIKRLNNELKLERQKYEDLQREYSLHRVSAKSTISDETINHYINTLLLDPAINIKVIPDKIERAVYNKLYTTLLHSLSIACDTTSVDILGHQLKFYIQPVSNTHTESLETNQVTNNDITPSFLHDMITSIANGDIEDEPEAVSEHEPDTLSSYLSNIIPDIPYF